VTLNSLGYNRYSPHAVANAPTTLFGCGLLDSWLEQGLFHLQALLAYVGTDQKIWRAMNISLRSHQVEEGVSFNLLRQPKISVPHLSVCIMMQLRQFCTDKSKLITFQRFVESTKISNGK
jgi:hypothetical protein